MNPSSNQIKLKNESHYKEQPFSVVCRFLFHHALCWVVIVFSGLPDFWLSIEFHNIFTIDEHEIKRNILFKIKWINKFPLHFLHHQQNYSKGINVNKRLNSAVQPLTSYIQRINFVFTSLYIVYLLAKATSKGQNIHLNSRVILISFLNTKSKIVLKPVLNISCLKCNTHTHTQKKDLMSFRVYQVSLALLKYCTS